MDHTVIPIPHLGAPIAFRPCPEGDPSPLHSIAMAALGPITTLNAEWGKVAADADLSPEGKIKKLAPALKTAQETITRQQQAVAARVAEYEGDTLAFYAPPALESADAVGALLDRERRDWLSELDADSRAAVLHQMQEGKHEELLLALVRSPVPVAWSELVGRIWQEAVEKKRPVRAGNLARRRESIEWANAVLSGFASRLPDERQMRQKLLASRNLMPRKNAA